MADDRTQRGRQLPPDLFALLRLEEVEDSANRLGGVLGVQRGKHQVAGVGSTDGRLKRNGIAHFTDHDDVRILAKHVLQAGLEAAGIQTNFSLFDHGLVVFEDELDGVF